MRAIMDNRRAATKRGVGAALAALGVVAVVLAGAGPADAIRPHVVANTIDGQATFRSAGGSVRVTGPIGCTRGANVSIRVGINQSATDARAGESWQRRCTGELQHWQIRAPARTGARFAVTSRSVV